MTLKNAAFFALVGMALLTVLLTWELVTDFSGVFRGYLAARVVAISLIQWLASLSLLIFFAAFYRTA